MDGSVSETIGTRDSLLRGIYSTYVCFVFWRGYSVHASITFSIGQSVQGPQHFLQQLTSHGGLRADLLLSWLWYRHPLIIITIRASQWQKKVLLVDRSQQRITTLIMLQPFCCCQLRRSRTISDRLNSFWSPCMGTIKSWSPLWAAGSLPCNNIRTFSFSPRHNSH